MLPHDEKGCSVIAIGNANTGPDRARSTPRGVDRKTVPGPDLQHWKWTKPWGLHTSYAGTTATITVPNSLSSGQIVRISGVTSTGSAIPTGYNGAFVVLSETSSQFTYTLGSNPGMYASGGTIEASPWGTSSTYQTGHTFDSIGESVSTTAPATSAAPSGIETTFSYDTAGNETSTTDSNGVTTTNSYTPEGQISSTSYSGSSAPTVTRVYDATGNQTSMV